MHDFSRKIYFYCWEKLQKNMYFHPKMAWPPAAYDVISQNHSNCLSLNSSQNVCKEWMNSYWKRQVLMFYPLGKNSKKPSSGAGGCHNPPPPPNSPTLYVVRPRVNTTITSFILYEKFLQFDWLRAVVFQLNLKYLHVKITKLLRVVV